MSDNSTPPNVVRRPSQTVAPGHIQDNFYCCQNILTELLTTSPPLTEAEFRIFLLAGLSRGIMAITESNSPSDAVPMWIVEALKQVDVNDKVIHETAYYFAPSGGDFFEISTDRWEDIKPYMKKMSAHDAYCKEHKTQVKLESYVYVPPALMGGETSSDHPKSNRQKRADNKKRKVEE